MKPVLWADLTWEQIGDLRERGMDMVLFPVGSTEQHGPHLPLNVDTTLAEAVSIAVSASTGVPLLPTLPYGCALGHTREWPGTLSLSPNTLTQIICEIMDDVIAYGFGRILILSGHVANAAPLRCALEILRDRHPDLRIAQKHVMEASARTRAAYVADAEDFHANAAETALMMHLRPSQVANDKIFDDPDRTSDLVFSYTVPYTSVAGHTGRPSTATPQMGEQLFALLVNDWVGVVERALIEEPPVVPRADRGKKNS